MLNKKLALWIIFAVIVVLILGYLGYTYSIRLVDRNNAPSNTSQNPNSNSGGTPNNNSPTNNPDRPSSPKNDEIKQLINTLVGLAEQGKVINSNFSAKDYTIDDVEKAWGKPDKTDYVAQAKGTYATYEKRGVVFAFNKGLQLFEVRSFDSRLKTLTLKEVEQVLGVPDYDKIISGNQHIIGYEVNATYKLEFIFPQENTNQPNPPLDHLNVLYPAGTVNSMADDPGRQW